MLAGASGGQRLQITGLDTEMTDRERWSDALRCDGEEISNDRYVEAEREEKRGCPGKPCSVPAPEAAFASLVSDVVLLSHGL